MTFSILMRDPETGSFAAAAATGSLCVGGWVLRGDIEAGLIASQGTAPSSFWRDGGLRQLHDGGKADAVVQSLTRADAGRGHRQLSALDRQGRAGAFTGADSVPFAGHLIEDNLVVAGNMLTGENVLREMRQTALKRYDSLASCMISVLQSAERAGGDTRGLLSAALLVLRPDHPPLDLRIDHDADPVVSLARLRERVEQPPYRDWLQEVPVLSDRFRAPQP